VLSRTANAYKFPDLGIFITLFFIIFLLFFAVLSRTASAYKFPDLGIFITLFFITLLSIQ